MTFFNKVKHSAAVFFMIAAAAYGSQYLSSQELIQALKLEISGEIAKRYTERIALFDRIQAAEGWRQAAEMIRRELVSMGYSDAGIEGWPSDGSRYYGAYRPPVGWKAHSAELWMVAPQKERLCSFEEIPLTLVKHSGSAHVSAELVDVGTGLGEGSYQGRDVEGKIVLATGYSGDVAREAVLKRGALGVITWFSPETHPGWPNMIRYTAIWPGWEDRNSLGFGFNVSKLQGWRLKKMLEEG